MFISRAYSLTLLLNRGEKDGENLGITVENKHLNGLQINLACVIITFNNRFSVLTFAATLG